MARGGPSPKPAQEWLLNLAWGGPSPKPAQEWLPNLAKGGEGGRSGLNPSRSGRRYRAPRLDDGRRVDPQARAEVVPKPSPKPAQKWLPNLAKVGEGGRSGVKHSRSGRR